MAQTTWNFIVNNLLFFAKIGDKIAVNDEEFEKIWRNLNYLNRVYKRKRKFKYEAFNQKHMIWRTK